jgi:hypothetical protein
MPDDRHDVGIARNSLGNEAAVVHGLVVIEALDADSPAANPARLVDLVDRELDAVAKARIRVRSPGPRDRNDDITMILGRHRLPVGGGVARRSLTRDARQNHESHSEREQG